MIHCWIFHRAETLYDRPADMFQQTSLADAHQLFTKLAQQYEVFDNRSVCIEHEIKSPDENQMPKIYCICLCFSGICQIAPFLPQNHRMGRLNGWRTGQHWSSVALAGQVRKKRVVLCIYIIIWKFLFAYHTYYPIKLILRPCVLFFNLDSIDAGYIYLDLNISLFSSVFWLISWFCMKHFPLQRMKILEFF